MVAGFHILSLLSSAAGGPVFFVPGDEASAKAQSPLLNLALWGQDGLRGVEASCPAWSPHQESGVSRQRVTSSE